MMIDTVADKRVAEKNAPGERTTSRRLNAVGMLGKVVATVLLLGVLAAVGLGSAALFSGRWMASPVLSGSMRPGLAVGGLVIGQRVPVKSLAVRDVIIFRRPDNPTEQMVHRIIQTIPGSSGQRAFRTQGDANSGADPWTLTIRQPYTYRVRWSVPLVGYAVVAFQNHRGYVLLVAGMVALLVGGSVLLEKSGQERADSEEMTVPAPASE
jgi:signal peptidase I